MSDPDFFKKIDDFTTDLTSTAKKNDSEIKEQEVIIKDLENRKRKLESNRETLRAQLQHKDEIMNSVNETFRELSEQFHLLKVTFEKPNIKTVMCTHLESMRRREKFKEMQLNVLKSLIESFKRDMDYTLKAYDNNNDWVIYQLLGNDPMTIIDARQEVIIMEEVVKLKKKFLAEKEDKSLMLKKAMEGYEIEEAKLKGRIFLERKKEIEDEEFAKIEKEIIEQQEIIENLKAELDFARTDLNNMELAHSHYSDELASLPSISGNDLAAAKEELCELQVEKELVPNLANRIEMLTLRSNQIRCKAEKLAVFLEQKKKEQLLIEQKYNDHMEKAFRIWAHYERDMKRITSQLTAKLENARRYEATNAKCPGEELARNVVAKLKVNDSAEKKENVIEESLENETAIKEDADKIVKEQEKAKQSDVYAEDKTKECKTEQEEDTMNKENDLNTAPFSLNNHAVNLEMKLSDEESSTEEPDTEEMKKKMCIMQ